MYFNLFSFISFISFRFPSLFVFLSSLSLSSVIIKRDQKYEIFVDLLERLTVLVASNGHVLRSHIDGSLVMRSFLGGNAGQSVYNRHYNSTVVYILCMYMSLYVQVFQL